MFHLSSHDIVFEKRHILICRFMVMMILMLCSGGSYWYRRRRYVITQDAAGNTYVHTATGNHAALSVRAHFVPLFATRML